MSMHFSRRALAAGSLCTVALLTPLAAAAAPDGPAQPRYGPGAAGAGDAYFPLAGNGGIDVLHYDLDLDYTPPLAGSTELVGTLTGVATLEIEATQDLDQFDLDLRDLAATSVVIGGLPMHFEQSHNELVITPRPKLKTGQEVQVVIAYGGPTGRPTDIEGALYGWVTTADGAMVVNEPEGAATWFPVNDHPTDKASYSFDITVPAPLVAVANGTLVDSETTQGRTTWTWDAPDPMAAYLATATVGNFELTDYVSESGVPVLDAIDADLTPANRATTEASLARVDAMLTFFAERYGPYPFVSYGHIVDDDTVGYALETQTRSFFSLRARESTVAHELAHQWMGNQVSPERWADIWLNEGWASYSTWLWREERGLQTVQAAYEDVLSIPSDDAFWEVVVADPGPFGLFHDAVYDRGAATLHALRLAIGDEDFFAVARTWVAEYGGGTASTQDFEALAEEVSGEDLDSLFTAWLHTGEKPTTW
jgi:aminopeptidase N